MDISPSDVVSPRRLWGWAIVIALAGVAARALWYLNFKDDLPLRPGPDGYVFIGQAKSFLAGAISDPNANGLATAYKEAFPPGYGLFLAGLWAALPRADVLADADYVWLTAFAAQWLLAGLTTLMTFALARRVLIGYSALIPPVLLTLSVALIDLPNAFAYETLLVFLITATVMLLVKAHDAAALRWREGLQRAAPTLLSVLAGLTLSAAILTQPRVAILLPFATWWLVRAAGGRHAVVFLVIALLLPGAWIARDYSLFGRVVPISIDSQASLYEDNVDPVGGKGFTPGAMPPQCRSDWINSPLLTEHFVWANCMTRAGANEIIDHPSKSALAIPDRLAAMISPWNPAYARGNYSSNLWGYQDVVPRAVRNDTTFIQAEDVLVVVFLVLYAGFALIGLYALWAEGPGAPARLIATTIIVVPIAQFVFHGENRSRILLLPFLLISITLGIVAAWDFFASQRDKRVGT
jgi:hypothetical protein